VAVRPAGRVRRAARADGAGRLNEHEDGEIPREVWDTAKSISGPLFVSRSYADPAKDKAGLHQLARGTLPGQNTTVTGEFAERGHIEIYYRSRMTGLTWHHVRGTPTDTLPNATEAIAELVETYGDSHTGRQANRDSGEIATSCIFTTEGKPPEEIDGNTTADIDDIFRTIREIDPSDIRLQSTLTEDNGTRKSYNPSWEQSNSGTRLGYDSLNGGGAWIYRKNNHPVDALQVVAREEGLIHDITEYPEGKTFWKAVQALRDRGATIPYFEGSDGLHPDMLQLYAEPEALDEQRKHVLRTLRADNQ